jgi:hypothetical protein
LGIWLSYPAQAADFRAALGVARLSVLIEHLSPPRQPFSRAASGRVMAEDARKHNTMTEEGGPMIVRCVSIASSVVLAASLALTYEARSRTIFDGRGSALIITERGDICDRAYRYPVRIRNGVVRYEGDFSIDLSGRIAANGAVRVRIARGNRSADGVGRLSRNSGAGTWQGRSSRGQCSGRWQAALR